MINDKFYLKKVKITSFKTTKNYFTIQSEESLFLFVDSFSIKYMSDTDIFKISLFQKNNVYVGSINTKKIKKYNFWKIFSK